MVSEPSGRGGERPFTQTDTSRRAEARPSEASAATTVYFVAGERSGDDHGAALLKALRARVPEMRFGGRGGPKMRALAGGKFRDWIDDTAVVGLWEVIRRYPFFRKQFQATISEIEAVKPRAVVLISYPGINFRLSHALYSQFPSATIIFFTLTH